MKHGYSPRLSPAIHTEVKYLPWISSNGHSRGARLQLTEQGLNAHDIARERRALGDAESSVRNQAAPTGNARGSALPKLLCAGTDTPLRLLLVGPRYVR